MSTDLKTRLDELAEAREQRKADAYAAYMQLLADTVDGTDVDGNYAASVLDDIEKSDEQFQQDCETKRKRVMWAATLAALPERQAEFDATNEAIGKLVAERNELCAKLNAKISDLVVKRDTFEQVLGAANTAARNLQMSAWPHKLEAVERIKRELKVRGGGQRELRDYIQRWESALSGRERELAGRLKGLIPGSKDKAKLKQLKADIKRIRDHVDEAKLRLKEKREISDECANRLGAAEQDLLNP